MLDYNKFIGTIDNSFLSHNEIEDVKTKIFNHHHLWQTSPYRPNARFFPYGLYSEPLLRYAKSVSNYKDILDLLFSSYYEKIQQRLSNIFQRNCCYHNFYCKPGFHIFGPKELDYTHLNFHYDLFSNRVFGKLYSFIIPIMVPESGAGLLYCEPEDKNIASAMKNPLTLKYTKPGMLAMWDATILHAIKPFTLKENEYRITWQFHVAIRDPNPIIFW